MGGEKNLIPDNVDERIKLIVRIIERKCNSLHVRNEGQHIQIVGAADELTKQERSALRELGIEHSKYGAKLYKESDEYRNYIKHLIERRLITVSQQRASNHQINDGR
jgi:hypothetical protein